MSMCTKGIIVKWQEILYLLMQVWMDASELTDWEVNHTHIFAIGCDFDFARVQIADETRMQIFFAAVCVTVD